MMGFGNHNKVAFFMTLVYVMIPTWVASQLRDPHFCVRQEQFASQRLNH
jgi:hypothetical protein